MKKIVLFLCLISAVSLQSQNSIQLTNMANSATVTAGTVINQTVAANGTASLNIDIKNTGGTVHAYGVKRYVSTLHATMSGTAITYFSFAAINYAPNVNNSVSQLTLNAGQSATQLGSGWHFTIQLDETTSAGYSQVKYTVYNIQQAADSIQFTVIYNLISNVMKRDNEILASRIFQVNDEEWMVELEGANDGSAQIEITDVYGRLVKKIEPEFHESKAILRIEKALFLNRILIAHINSSGLTRTVKLLNH